MTKKTEAKARKQAKKALEEGRHLRSSPQKPVLKMFRDSDNTKADLKLSKAPKPRKDIIVEAKWLGKTSDGHVTTLEEAFVRRHLGNTLQMN
jgi:hypothetical protein